MSDYSTMSNEDFNRLLAAVMDEEVSPSALLAIPGIYEVVSEHYNNAVLDAWTAEQQEAKEAVKESEALPYTAKYSDPHLQSVRYTNAVYQIIYTTDGRDYCREQAPANIVTPDEARAYARKMFLKIADDTSRKFITGFWLDRF